VYVYRASLASGKEKGVSYPCRYVCVVASGKISYSFRCVLCVLRAISASGKKGFFIPFSLCVCAFRARVGMCVWLRRAKFRTLFVVCCVCCGPSQLVAKKGFLYTLFYVCVCFVPLPARVCGCVGQNFGLFSVCAVCAAGHLR